MILVAGCAAEPLPRAPVEVASADAATPVDLAGYLVEIDGTAHLLRPAHGLAEFLGRRVELGAELPKLSAEDRARVMPRIDILSVVSVAEGSFEGVATHPRDPMASLGIFQWAGERKGPVTAGSSLYRFFSTLAGRAQRCEENPGLACTAWRECNDAGLALRDDAITLGGKRATGAKLERALGEQFGRGALRTYQLVAATDWVEQIASTPITTPAGVATTVGALLPGKRGLALAVLLGVNRPAYVVPALMDALRASTTTTGQQLLPAFRAAALSRYPAHDRARRAMRLLTAELLSER